MVYSSDPKFFRGLASPQVSSKDCIIGYIKEANHGMPAFIVKPHLKESESRDSFKKPSLITLSCRKKLGCLLSTLVGTVTGRNPGPGMHSSQAQSSRRSSHTMLLRVGQPLSRDFRELHFKI